MLDRMHDPKYLGPQDISLLEYCDDVKHFEAHGHADCRGYAMATALANDLFSNLQKVTQSKLFVTQLKFASESTKWLVLSEASCMPDPWPYFDTLQ